MPRTSASLIAFASTLALAACATPRSDLTTGDVRAALMGDYLMGRYADLTNDPSVAARNYLSALRRAPGDAILLEGAVDSALVAGDIEQAAAAANVAKAQGVDSALGRLTLMTIALRDGDAGKARALAAKGEGPPFDRLAGRVLRAWAFAADKQTDQALAALGDSSDGAPFARLFDFQRAMILERGGRTPEAMAAYKAAFNNGQRSSAAVIAYGALLERTGGVDAAIALYERVLADGDEPIVAAALARAQRGAAPEKSALDRPGGGAATGLFSLAAVLVGQTDASFYLPYLTLALALDPGLDGARLVVAGGLQEMRQWDGASAALDRVAPTSPLFERAAVQRIFLLRERGDRDGALAYAREIAAHTQGRLARLALADLLRDDEKWAEAEPIYDALLREDAGDGAGRWRLYFARGACRERIGDWPRAQADLEAALALQPDQPDVLNYLGYSWIDRGENLREGMKLIERAVALKPDAGHIVDSLGWAYFKLGEYKAAVEQLERAVELSPDDPILNDHLGDAYWRVSRRAEARFQWTRSLTLEPNAPDAQATRAKLSGGLPAPPVARTARVDGGP